MAGVTLVDHRSGRNGHGAPPHGDEPTTLYAKRKQIYPQLAFGRFRSAKWILLSLFLGVYYLLPWLRWDRGPDAPNQAVLADFSAGRFYFFGLEIWPQEVYYITGLLILAAVGLFLVTAVFGRVWCGYACPQTIWTDLFLVVERFFEGDRNARMRLDKAPWTAAKAARKISKHAVWILIAFATGGAFILYWHDAPNLARTFFIGQAPMTAYVFAALLTFTTYSLAGTMREQVCTYMCPWPRIQSALIDRNTLAVTYRSDRGEPRGPHKKGEPWEGRGDCIDCHQCVVVCPMGIDIRNGSQLECIGCALCIDACTGIMKKVGRPTGLIAYDTDDNVAARSLKQTPAPFRLLRPRVIVYALVFAITAGIMIVGLLTRPSFSVNVIKDRSLAFVMTSAGEVRQGYTLKLTNKQRSTRTLDLSAEGLPGARIELVGEGKAASVAHATAEPDGVDRYRILLTAPLASLRSKPSVGMRFVVTDPVTGERHATASVFSGPGAKR
ncbi:MAG: cytochrome c oxidase accessory protein CcoG [Alphaproteobacteria bacterium]|nr:cytochrome c oxidase accessory protein CcoG [Alphaproteobacteria bacterium]